MAAGPITSWQIDGEAMEMMRDFIFLFFSFLFFFLVVGGSSKITADGDGSHEIKGLLLLGRKVMTPRQHIKNRHYFANKAPSSHGYAFSISHV